MTQVFAHRGYSGRYPENTLLAFQQAADAGADGIELDVHLSRDQQLVVIHDELLDRTTDGTGFVRDHTLAELKRLDASGPYRGKLERNPIPTLEEVLAWMAPLSLHLNIELKTGLFDYPGLEEQVWAMVEQYRMQQRVVFSSFHAESLLRLKRLAPEASCGLLRGGSSPMPGQYIRRLGLQAYHPLFVQLDRAAVADLKANGLAIRPYTPNSPISLRYLMRLGVDAVITNFPVRALRLRRHLSGTSLPSTSGALR